MTLTIRLTLASDGTFGRGDGVAGLVDEEVEHDAATGLPFLRGRTLKGLLVEECANVLFALGQQDTPRGEQLVKDFQEPAQFLFGQAGSTLADDAHLHVGPALLPEELRLAVAEEVKSGRLTPADVLESLTAIRRQTAMDEATGAPERGSLRSMRVLLRTATLVARLDFDAEPGDEAAALLAASVLALRRAGTGRNRGRGRLVASLCDEQGNDVTPVHFARFQQLVHRRQS